MSIGRFMEGSITGLYYQTASINGFTNEKGEYHYAEGECVTFSIGGIMLGSLEAKQIVTPLDFVVEATGRITKPTHYQVVNMSRILLSLGKITKLDHEVISKYKNDIEFVLEPNDFETQPELLALLDELGKTLCSADKAINLVRRTNAGIYKESDVKIPTGGENYVLADIYRPLKEGKFPVIMCMGVFGKSFINGLTLNEEDEAMFDMVENKFYESYGNIETKKMLQGIFFKRMGPCFGSALPIPNVNPKELAPHPSGPPANLVPVSEVFEQPAALDWVPNDYVVINIEEFGVGKNSGQFRQFGEKNANDYYHAIEWAANQEWSSGKIGLFGASYYAMTQYLVAQKKPKGLTAMIPIMGDYDSYRDYIYSGGGLFNRADNMDPCIPPQKYTFMSKAMEQPFWNEETYGPEGEYMSSCDIKKIDYPIWTCVEPDASLHGKGSSEAFINCSSKNKKLTVLNGCGIHFWMYNQNYLDKFRAFFDFWLKGTQNGIMNEPPVKLQVRTGNGNYYWRQEEDWPVPNTKYMKFYLNATSNALATEIPESEGKTTYNADVMHSETMRVAGATYISEPMDVDLEIAGYIKAMLYISSTTSDMELHMNIRVLDENNKEVIYPALTSMERGLPLGFGSLKVSHRKLDQSRSRDYLPVYQHTKEAYQPLTPNEIVECEIGTFPTTGLIRKGWKIQLELDPVGNRWVCFDEEEYRKDSLNSIFTGKSHPSFVQLPIIPKK